MDAGGVVSTTILPRNRTEKSQLTQQRCGYV